ncbi:MAG: monoterpene epsilon-lactone hydrolase [Glaciecola sp.]|jgi:monoterpene epsilon-lactone hydrolase
MFEGVGELLGDPPGAILRDGRAGDVPVQWLDFPEHDMGSDAPIVFYVHGGAYAMGSIVASRHAAATHIRALGGSGLVVGYRLAPEHPFPAAVDDVCMAWNWLLDEVDPARVVALGESAGGGLLIAAMTRLRDQGTPLPAAAVTVSAWANLSNNTPSYTQNRRRDLALNPALLEHAAQAYAGATERTHPEMSPVHGDLAGLPPLLLAVGTDEVVWDDTIELHRRAVKAGVNARLLIGERQLHCWTGYTDMLPAARDAVRQIADFGREHVAHQH